jgi:hypothetical protein
MAGTVYLVTNNLNGKQYVGQTTIVNNKVGHGKLCIAAYRKYGKENFTYEHICSKINNRLTLNFIERFWIKTMNSRLPNGYNIEHGGSNKDRISEETRKKLSIAKLGKKQSPEHIAKVVEALKNRSQEVKQKSGNKLRGRKRDPAIALKVAAKQIGKFVSEETKAKIKEARSRQVITKEHKQKLSDAAKRQWARQKGVM